MPKYYVKKYREEAGLTQAELAARSGVSRGIIIRLESGDLIETTTGTLIAIADALGKKVSEIFY